MALPDPQQMLWTNCVYYVVNLCPCGHSYYYPSRRQLRIDELTPQVLQKEIEDIPRRLDTSCAQCKRRATAQDARRAVLGLGMPDRVGCILCDFTIENGQVQRTRYRFDSTPDPIQYFREHPDYFRTRPPDNSPSDLDDQLCFQELGRVLNVRSCWDNVLRNALDNGADFCQIQDGYYLFATTANEAHKVECQMRELAGESFWHYFQNEPIPRRRLNGIDLWTPDQRKRAHLDQGTYREWLAPELVEAIEKGLVHALAFCIDSVSLQYVADAASFFHLEVDEVILADSNSVQWWIRNGMEVARQCPPIELMQLDSIYRGTLLSDQIWMTFRHLTQHLERESNVYQELQLWLPPNFSTQWADLGKLMISRGDHPLELLTFAHIADQIDPNDQEALSKLVSWLVSEKACKCKRYVGKRLMSKRRFQECSAEILRDPSAFIYREIEDKLIEIYTDECEHHVIYGLRRANGDLQRAESMYQKSLSEQRHSLRYIKRKASLLGGGQMVALLGRDASSIIAHPALLRGVIDELNLRLGNSIRLFVAFNGILAISSLKVSPEKLEKFVYEIAREMPEEPELKSDHLAYYTTIELAEDASGTFSLEALNISS
jgi:hypothetical protein